MNHQLQILFQPVKTVATIKKRKKRIVNIANRDTIIIIGVIMIYHQAEMIGIIVF